jgi:hypothetical protein
MENEHGVSLERLMTRLDKAVKEHSTHLRLDSFLYNGGTIAVLLATFAATVWPQEAGEWTLIPKLLTAFAGFWVAVERVLSFGARWRFHIEMKNAYRSIQDEVDLYRHRSGSLTKAERQQGLDTLWQKLLQLREREAAIPGNILSSAAPSAQNNTPE